MEIIKKKHWKMKKRSFKMTKLFGNSPFHKEKHKIII